MESSEIINALARLPLFETVSQAHLKIIREAVSFRNLKKGQFLFQAGDASEGFYQLLHGRIKLIMISQQGNEKVVEIINKYQGFGEAVMFSGKPYPVHSQAVEDSQLLYIPKTVVFDLMDKDNTFVRKIIAGMSFRLHMLMKELENITFRGSIARVANYLLQNSNFNIDCESSKTQTKNQTSIVKLNISKQMLASKLNITPETLSRIFANLTNGGIIAVDKKIISIKDVKALISLDSGCE